MSDEQAYTAQIRLNPVFEIIVYSLILTIFWFGYELLDPDWRGGQLNRVLEVMPVWIRVLIFWGAGFWGLYGNGCLFYWSLIGRPGLVIDKSGILSRDRFCTCERMRWDEIERLGYHGNNIVLRASSVSKNDPGKVSKLYINRKFLGLSNQEIEKQIGFYRPDLTVKKVL